MPLYMYQVSYTSDAWKTQIQHPQNRSEHIRAVLEAHGGKLLGFYYTFGEYDVVLIAEAPDNVAAAALALATTAGGALKAIKTTPLMSVEEGMAAMQKASGTGYRPPGS